MTKIKIQNQKEVTIFVTNSILHDIFGEKMTNRILSVFYCNFIGFIFYSSWVSCLVSVFFVS